MLSKIKNTNNKEKKAKIVKEYYDSFCKHRQAFREEQQWKPEMEEDGRSSYYCILRCLIPNADMARPAYGLQIPTLGKVYIKVLQVRRAPQWLACARWSTLGCRIICGPEMNY
ncbi:hypothetical protein DOY81_015659, partial [Sarcophaga bullata]